MYKKIVFKFEKPERLIKKVFIHCSDSDIFTHDDISVIRKWHIHERNWNDVGYHFFITKKGLIQGGRSLEKLPAAQRGHNNGSIAICVSGKEQFTKDSLKSLREMCEKINKAYSRKLTFHGHCEVSKKKCPVFDYKKILNLDEEGYIKKPFWKFW